MKHPVNIKHHGDDRSFGERVADACAAGIGSWTFLGLQLGIILLWMVLNVTAWVSHWDPYPWLALNIGLSLQASVTGPLLLLAGKRQAVKDRDTMEHDYETNVHALDKLTRVEHLNRRILQALENNTERTLDILAKVGRDAGHSGKTKSPRRKTA